MIKWIILLLFSLPACGEAIDDLPFVRKNDYDFERERGFFESITQQKTHEIPIQYGHLPNTVIAQCQFMAFKGRLYDKHIIVNHNIFPVLGPEWRRAVIAHELIHCHLELDHTCNETNANETFQIMAKFLPTWEELSEEVLIKALQPYHK